MAARAPIFWIVMTTPAPEASTQRSIPCTGFLVLQFCEEHHGLTFSLIEASLNVRVTSLLGRVLEDQVSMMHVPSGGADQFMAMQSTAWCAYSGVEAHKYYV